MIEHFDSLEFVRAIFERNGNGIISVENEQNCVFTLIATKEELKFTFHAFADRISFAFIKLLEVFVTCVQYERKYLSVPPFIGIMTSDVRIFLSIFHTSTVIIA